MSTSQSVSQSIDGHCRSFLFLLSSLILSHRKSQSLESCLTMAGRTNFFSHTTELFQSGSISYTLRTYGLCTARPPIVVTDSRMIWACLYVEIASFQREKERERELPIVRYFVALGLSVPHARISGMIISLICVYIAVASTYVRTYT